MASERSPYDSLLPSFAREQLATIDRLTTQAEALERKIRALCFELEDNITRLEAENARLTTAPEEGEEHT